VLEYFIANNWIVPGTMESPLLQRILSTDPNFRMPKVGSITAEQQTLIQKWILGAAK
jgi:hypothetical protein